MTLIFRFHLLLWEDIIPFKSPNVLLIIVPVELSQRFWDHGVPCCTDLRAAGGTSVYLKVTRRGFLLRRRPRWSSVLGWLVTSKSLKNCRGCEGYVWFELPEVFEDWRWCTDVWLGLKRKYAGILFFLDDDDLYICETMHHMSWILNAKV